MKSQITSYRYGSERQPGDGLRIGASRHVPRGVRRGDWQRRNYFDLWLPLVSPSAELVSDYQKEKITFKVFSRRYKTEMKTRESQQVIELLAAMSLFQPVAVGCFCEDESRCHRSLLRQLIAQEAKARAKGLSDLWEEAEASGRTRYASPVCFGPINE